jgi:FKBP-type peptidyl-prolyl cis-trans isomerase 2
MIPHLLKMIIVDSGNGGTPMAGDFIRLKQFTYLEDMTLVKAERLTYLFGRGHLLPGLEVCLAMCREGFKARCFLASCYAYGNEKVGKIQKNSCLVIDIEVTGITKEPLTRERM